MSLSWSERKNRLAQLLKLKENIDEDEEYLALDRLLHGRSVIGKTAKTDEVESLRFHDKDLQILGTLEFGQFGIIHVVKCSLDGRLYVRKSMEKRFAQRNREQCHPMHERNILVQATKKRAHWVPHLLTAFHTTTHLNFVMEYCDGGSLQDVLDSSPDGGRVSEQDILWWAPQIVSAIDWCHSLGWAHRDIKPSNLVISPQPTPRLRLIDFGSSAPAISGTRILAYQHCTVPCGTCDYISPEILNLHEEALVAFEMEQDGSMSKTGYGLQTDWWSFGAMVYEMAFGATPFFASNIQRTYLRIMDHQNSLKFDSTVKVSQNCENMLRRLLTEADERLGKDSAKEIMRHPFFNGLNWEMLQNRVPHSNLHVPQFAYSGPTQPGLSAVEETSQNASQSYSKPWAFSALFQSSMEDSSEQETPKAGSLLRSLSKSLSAHSPQSSAEDTLIGFSWGPTVNAFDDTTVIPSPAHVALPDRTNLLDTPQPLRQQYRAFETPNPFLVVPQRAFSTPLRTPGYPLRAQAGGATPFNFNPLTTPYQTHTLPRTKPSARRPISEREALQQLMDCVGMSARKRVLQSGRKPKLPTNLNTSGNSSLRGLRGLKFKDEEDASGKDGKETETETESEMGGHPPSPSPSPRPWSVARSETPMLTGTFGTFSQRISSASMVSGGGKPSWGASVSRHQSMNDETEVSELLLDKEYTTDEEDTPKLEQRSLDVDKSMKERHDDLMGTITDLEKRLQMLYKRIDGCC